MPDLRHTFNCGTVIILGEKISADEWVLWFEDQHGNKISLKAAYLSLYGYYNGSRKHHMKIWKHFQDGDYELHMTDRERDDIMCHFASTCVKFDLLCPCHDDNCTACSPIIARRKRDGESTDWRRLF